MLEMMNVYIPPENATALKLRGEVCAAESSLIRSYADYYAGRWKDGDAFDV